MMTPFAFSTVAGVPRTIEMDTVQQVGPYLFNLTGWDASLLHKNPVTIAPIENMSLHLTFSTPPRFRHDGIREYEVLEGLDSKISIPVEGSLPFTYQWKKDGVNFSDGDTVLTFDGTRLDDAGEYRLVVSNAAGTVTSEPHRMSVTRSSMISLQSNVPETSIRLNGKPVSTPYWLYAAEGELTELEVQTFQFHDGDEFVLTGDNQKAFFRVPVKDTTVQINYSSVLKESNSFVYPTLVTDNFRINILSRSQGKLEVTIYDMNYRPLSSVVHPLKPGKNELVINCQALKPATYVVRWNWEGKAETRRIVKVN